jgi:hypothetical protein
VVIDAAAQSRIDPNANSKSLEVFRGTTQGLLAGMTREEACAHAIEQEPLHQPPPPAVHPLTPKEQWTSNYVESSIKALAQVPENDKEEVIERGTAELHWLLTKRREPVRITPVEPTVDRSGRRREPEHETARSYLALSELAMADLARARAAFDDMLQGFIATVRDLSAA